MKENPNMASYRLEYIDGLRGLALTMVLLYHIWLFGGAPFPQWWNLLGYGYFGVNLFLVLSGFCLYWPFVKNGQSQPEISLMSFAKRRARRIMPPYYAVLVIFTICALLTSRKTTLWPEYTSVNVSETIHAFLWHFLLVHNLRPEFIWSIDGPLWSLALEVSLYVAMPVLVEVARRYGIKKTVVFASLTTMVYRIGLDYYIGGASGWEQAGHDHAYTLCYFLPGRWLEFALGMWAASIVASGSSRHARLPLGLLSFTCLVAAVVLGKKWGMFYPATDPLCGLGFFFLILHAARPSENVAAWSLAGLLRNRCAVQLGVISYSVYLIHQPLLRLMIQFSQPHLHRVALILGACFFVFLPLILGVAYLFHLVVEKPFTNAPRKPKAATPPIDPGLGALSVGTAE